MEPLGYTHLWRFLPLRGARYSLFSLNWQWVRRATDPRSLGLDSVGGAALADPTEQILKIGARGTGGARNGTPPPPTMFVALPLKQLGFTDTTLLRSSRSIDLSLTLAEPSAVVYITHAQDKKKKRQEQRENPKFFVVHYLVFGFITCFMERTCFAHQFHSGKKHDLR